MQRLFFSTAALLAAVGLSACETSDDACADGRCGPAARPCGSNQYRDGGLCKAISTCRTDEYQVRGATETSDRVCAAVTTCTSAQYEQRAPSATSDRVCRMLTECGLHEYETKAATARSDRECRLLTRCDATEYESVAATATSDRECSKLTRCDDDEYETVAATATSDRQCHGMTLCYPGQYQVSAPTSTSDRVCAEVSECDEGEYEVSAATATKDRVCAAIRECAGHEYQVSAPTLTSDRVCAPLTVCNSLQYETAPASALSDRECASLTECASYEYEAVAATATSDRVCMSRTVCTANQYASNPGSPTSDTECAALTVCSEGQYEAVPPTPRSDRLCAAITECDEDEYETAAPTATSDRECAPVTECTSTEYETAAPTATSNRECAPYTVCTADEYESLAPTATSDRECTPLTVCEEGQEEITPPTATSDRVCCNDLDGDGICDDEDDSCDVTWLDSTTVPLDNECLVPDVEVEDPWNLNVEAYFDESPALGSVSAVVVANLDDDNGDLVIDDRDSPEFIYTVIDDAFGEAGFLGHLVVRHADGSVYFTRAGILGTMTVLVADIDQDGDPEIITQQDSSEVIALSADGQVVEWTSVPVTQVIGYGVTPSVGDIDGDGDLEVVVNSEDGALLALAGESGDVELVTSVNASIAPVTLGDLDRDGSAEILAGTLLLAGDGTVLFDSNSTEMAFNGILNADEDEDGEAIFVITTSYEVVPQVAIVDPDGTVLDRWAAIDPNWEGDDVGWGGPPCMADFDGDTTPEIAIPISTHLSVFELDGTALWSMPIQDFSGIAGCSAYDVDGDGAYDVLFGDEETLWIFDGADGTVRFSAESGHSSGTLWEYPTVADYDQDGSAEIFFPSNTFTPGVGRSGVVIYGHADDGWARAGPTWASHDYAPGRIGADNEVALEFSPWLVHNVYRARPTVETAATDLHIEAGESCTSSCEAIGVSTIPFRVTNTGRTSAPAGVVVGVYRAGQVAGEPLTSVELDEVVPSGGSVEAVVTIDRDLVGGASQLILVVDPETTLGECDATNNSATVDVHVCVVEEK